MNPVRNIRLLEAFSVCNGMMFAIPILVPFYRDQIGLQFGDFMIADAMFMATMMLFDVPTGWIADVWRRKTTIMTGIAFTTAAWALMAFSSSFSMALASEIVLGVGFSLFSGTTSAMLYDTLLSCGQEDAYVRLEGRRRAFAQYGTTIACIIGGLIYPLHHQLPMLLTVGFNLAGMFCVAATVEPVRHKLLAVKHPLADMLDTARYALHGHAEIGALILFSAVLYGTCKVIMWAQQPYYMALGLPENLFGILTAVGSGFAGLASHMSHKAQKYVSARRIVTLGWLLTIVTTAAAARAGLGGIAFLMVGGRFMQCFTEPHINNLINQHTGSERRATALSTASMLAQFVFIPVSIIIGQISDHAGIQTALVSTAVWLGAAGGILWLLGQKGRKTA